MEVEFTFTPDDDVESHRSYYRRGARGRLASTLLALLALAVVLALNAGRASDFDRTHIVLIGVLVALAGYAFYVYWSKRPGKGSFDPILIRVSATEEGISNRTPYIEQFSRWPAVMIVKVLDYGLAVQTLGFRFFVPMRVFGGKQQAAEIAELLVAMKARHGVRTDRDSHNGDRNSALS